MENNFNNMNGKNFDYSKFLDENGNLDYEKLEEYVQYMLKSLANKSGDSMDIFDNILNSTDSSKMMYTQNIGEEDKETFEKLIKTHNLKRDNLEIINDDKSFKFENIILHEDWVNSDKTIKMTRLYGLENAKTFLNNSELKELYNRIMEMCVEHEAYEKAAKYRDIINELTALPR